MRHKARRRRPPPTTFRQQDGRTDMQTKSGSHTQYEIMSGNENKILHAIACKDGSHALLFKRMLLQFTYEWKVQSVCLYVHSSLLAPGSSFVHGGIISPYIPPPSPPTFNLHVIYISTECAENLYIPALFGQQIFIYGVFKNGISSSFRTPAAIAPLSDPHKFHLLRTMNGNLTKIKSAKNNCVNMELVAGQGAHPPPGHGV